MESPLQRLQVVAPDAQDLPLNERDAVIVQALDLREGVGLPTDHMPRGADSV